LSVRFYALLGVIPTPKGGPDHGEGATASGMRIIDVGALPGSNACLHGLTGRNRRAPRLLTLAGAFFSTVAWSYSWCMPIVAVSVVPSIPFIESRESSQIVNADLLVHNNGQVALKLAAIRLKVFDKAGKLEIAREINGNGRPPALAAMGDLLLEPGKTVDLYQPFDRFDAAVDLSRLELELIFIPAREPTPPVVLIGEASVKVELRPKHFEPNPYCVPLPGLLLVHDGHDLYSHHRRHNLADPFDKNRSLAVNPNLYAYDFVRIDENGALFKGDMNRKESWLTFGQPIHAPTEGEVVEAVNNVPDNALINGSPVTPKAAERVDPDGLGNHVVLRGADGRVSWLLHMEASSVTVHRGQHVNAGDTIGRVGFSGDTLFPHLHYTVTSSDDYPSQGVPSYFKNFARVLGTRRIQVDRAQIDTGDIVEADASCSLN
jgi:hypothetical protein